MLLLCNQELEAWKLGEGGANKYLVARFDYTQPTLCFRTCLATYVHICILLTVQQAGPGKGHDFHRRQAVIRRMVSEEPGAEISRLKCGRDLESGIARVSARPEYPSHPNTWASLFRREFGPFFPRLTSWRPQERVRFRFICLFLWSFPLQSPWCVSRILGTGLGGGQGVLATGRHCADSGQESDCT